MCVIINKIFNHSRTRRCIQIYLVDLVLQCLWYITFVCSPFFNNSPHCLFISFIPCYASWKRGTSEHIAYENGNIFCRAALAKHPNHLVPTSVNKKGVVRQRNTRRGIYNPKERSRHTIRRQVQALEAALPRYVLFWYHQTANVWGGRRYLKQITGKTTQWTKKTTS